MKTYRYVLSNNWVSRINVILDNENIRGEKLIDITAKYYLENNETIILVIVE